MTYQPLPDLELLLHRYIYNPETGEITWRIPHGKHKNMKPGKNALTVSSRSKVMKINGKVYMASRIAWKMQTGQDPKTMEVKHLDGNWENLRFKNFALNQRLREPWGKT